jgi:hypothetical protein
MKLSHQGELGDQWRQAGLINIKEEPLTIEQAYSSFNDYWEPFTKGAGPGAPTSYPFRRNAANNSKRAYASACLEIATMAHLN